MSSGAYFTDFNRDLLLSGQKLQTISILIKAVDNKPPFSKKTSHRFCPNPSTDPCRLGDPPQVTLVTAPLLFVQQLADPVLFLKVFSGRKEMRVFQFYFCQTRTSAKANSPRSVKVKCHEITPVSASTPSLLRLLLRLLSSFKESLDVAAAIRKSIVS